MVKISSVLFGVVVKSRVKWSNITAGCSTRAHTKNQQQYNNQQQRRKMMAEIQEIQEMLGKKQEIKMMKIQMLRQGWKQKLR